MSSVTVSNDNELLKKIKGHKEEIKQRMKIKTKKEKNRREICLRYEDKQSKF